MLFFFLLRRHIFPCFTRIFPLLSLYTHTVCLFLSRCASRGHRDEYGKRIESPNDGGLQATGGAASASASADEDRVRGGNWWPAHGERHMFLVSSPLYCNAKEAQDKKANTNITEAFSAFRLSTPPLPGPCSFSFAQFLAIGLCIDFCCK
jgi:hypothetical protein